MRTRLLGFLVVLCTALLLVSRPSSAAPEAHILRVDPRASQSEGAPVLTTVVELVQNKRMSEAIAECATMRGDQQLDCQSEKLEAPQALYSPLAPFPEGAALFTVLVDGADTPAKFVSKARWGESLNQQGVGTAWLILIDASSSMGSRFEEAKAVANAFVGSMTAADIVDVMYFNDRQVVTDSKWQPAGAKGQVAGFINGLRSMYPSQGRVRPLFNIIKQAATDGFKDLGNVGSVQPPLHQAMVVLSNGVAGSDASSSGPGATMLQQYLTKGRFPEDNTVSPKTPLPVISVWFPAGGLDEFRQNAQEFMQGMANPEIGGFYDVVRTGQGAAKGAKIVQTIRTRFNQMHIVKWRVSCVSPTVTQTFKLIFTNTSTPILGDSTFKEVPMGIDPTAWPLDVNVQYTVDLAKKHPVEPGGEFKVFGDFCWGGEKDRAEVYFIPAGTQPPAAIAGNDIEGAKRAQQQLIASGMRGKAVQSSSSDVSFEAPDKDKMLQGQGDNAVARLVIYDNKAHRTSGVTATTVLTLKASEKQLPLLWIIGGAFGAVVVALLVVITFRSGGNKRRPAGGSAPAPVVAGGPAPVVAGPAPVVASPPQGGYGSPPAYQPQAPAPATPAQADFMYGGQPPQYGLTSGQPAHAAPPPDPYAQAGGYGGAPASRASISGAAGTYTVMPGFEMRVGRDGAQCQIALQEARVSGVHASLKFEAGQLWIRDERSNNGTFLNGNRIGPGSWTPVPAGTQLRFGPIEFAVRLE